MKTKLLVVGMLIFCSMFLAANVSAISYYYPDQYANWPGYPQFPFPVNPNDQIGSYPTIEGATIYLDDTNFLEKIVFDLVNPRNLMTLFINADWKQGEIYDQWEYFVQTTTNALIFKSYVVDPLFSPANYILVTGAAHWRIGHPYSIESSMLPMESPFLNNITYDGALKEYTFNFKPSMISFGDRFVVGLSCDCGNDVFITPPNGVPEPMSILLLGAGLVGVGIVGRRMRRK